MDLTKACLCKNCSLAETHNGEQMHLQKYSWLTDHNGQKRYIRKKLLCLQTTVVKIALWLKHTMVNKTAKRCIRENLLYLQTMVVKIALWLKHTMVNKCMCAKRCIRENLLYLQTTVVKTDGFDHGNRSMYLFRADEIDHGF